MSYQLEQALAKGHLEAPFSFLPATVFPAGNRSQGSNPLQSVPFDIQSWLLRGLNFLIRRVFVSASSAHRAQSPRLGADRLSP